MFFPCKVFSGPFDEETDERERDGDTLIAASKTFDDIRTVKVGERTLEHGVSSLNMLPGQPEECVGLKSVEVGDRTETYLFCFDLDGRLLKTDRFLGA